MFASFNPVAVIKRWRAPAPADTLYGALADLARAPFFYRPPYHVPDTLDGRFDLLGILVGTTCLRLSQHPESRALSQAVFDVMFRHVERNMREAGVGDLSVPKSMRAMIQSFYDRNSRCAAILLTVGSDAIAPDMTGILPHAPEHTPQALANWFSTVWWPLVIRLAHPDTLDEFVAALATMR